MADIANTIFRPAEEAFRSGTLVMSREPIASAFIAGWDDFPLNAALVLAATLFFLLTLDAFIHAGGEILLCCFRGRNNFRLEDSVPLVRSRNWCTSSSLLPFAIIAARYGLADCHAVLLHPAEWRSLVVIALFLAYIVLRFIMYKLFRPLKGNQEAYKVAHRSAFNFIAPVTAALLISIGILAICNCDILTTKKVLLWVLAAFYFLFIVVKAEILGSRYGVLTTFLYLCALEFTPTAALVGVIAWL